MPVNLTRVTVVGRFVDTEGDPLRGTIRFTPSFDVLTDPDENVIVDNTPVVATLDVDGAFAVSLLATNAPDVSPVGWTWQVAEPTGRTPYSVSVDYATPGGVLELLDAGGYPSGKPNPGTVLLARRIRDSQDYDDTTPPADGQAIVWSAGAGKYLPGDVAPDLGGTPVVLPEGTTAAAGQVLTVAEVSPLAFGLGGPVDSAAIVQTRAGVWATGAQGVVPTTTNATGVGAIRLNAKMPVSTTRWRLRLRNYRTTDSTAQTQLSGTGVRIGAPIINAQTGLETGDAVGGALTEIIPAGYTIPGDGSWYTSGWITAPAHQFTAFEFRLLAHGYDAGGSVTFARGSGQAWHATGANAAGGLAGSWDAPSNSDAGVPIEVQIEYEWVGAQRTLLALGDSIVEGQGGSSLVANTPTGAWPSIAAFRNGMVCANIGVGGSTTGQWNATSDPYWSRIDLSRLSVDAVAIGLGSNDAASTVALTTYQTGLLATIAGARTLVGDVPIYLANVTPRGLDATEEPLRLSYNDWLETLPGNAVACFDMSAAVTDPADSTLLLGAPTQATAYNYDGIHLTRRGYNKMAAAAGRIAA